MHVEVKGEGLGDLDRALRQFSKMVKKAEIVNEVKRR
jgi:ribosomal protein S21